MTFEAHVWLRALALEQPNREILIRDTQVHVSVTALAPGTLDRKVLIRDS